MVLHIVCMVCRMQTTPTAAGVAIKNARRDRGWTHSEMCAEIVRHPQLGKKYAIAARTIDNTECGRVEHPYTRAAFAMATVLGMQVSELWPA